MRYARLMAGILAAGSLWAGDSGFGLQAGASIPAGDLKRISPTQKPSPTVGVGLHYQLNLGGRLALRPRIDYARFQTGEDPVTRLTLSHTLLSGGLEGLAFLLSGQRGPYVSAGVHAGRLTETVAYPGGETSVTHIKSNYSAGAGWQWAQLGLEARYTALRNENGGLNRSLETLGLMVTFRF